jgi:uncharacterized protein YuzE
VTIKEEGEIDIGITCFRTTKNRDHMGIEYKELKEIEEDVDHGISYLRFTKLPVVRTESYAGGEVNVDLDAYGHVVGIEMLSSEQAELSALVDITKKYSLNLNGLRLAKRGSRLT